MAFLSVNSLILIGKYCGQSYHIIMKFTGTICICRQPVYSHAVWRKLFCFTFPFPFCSPNPRLRECMKKMYVFAEQMLQWGSLKKSNLTDFYKDMWPLYYRAEYFICVNAVVVFIKLTRSNCATFTLFNGIFKVFCKTYCENKMT